MEKFEKEERLVEIRKSKLKELEKLKIESYSYKYDVDSDSKEILEENKKLKKEGKSKKNISIAGRVVALRLMGKASFGHLQDSKGKIQFFVKEEIVGKNKYELLKKIIDLGDIIGINGSVFRTKTNELTINVKDFKLLAKSLRALPEKWHGLKDPEIRYRQRYLDLIANPDVKNVFEKRAEIINLMREFLMKNKFVEVELPVLQTIYGGASAKPFKTHLNTLNIDLFLSISPELYLKRLIVGGFGNVYSIGKNFRNEGIDKSHNPEFTMMECYSAYNDYNYGMDLCKDLINFIVKNANKSLKVKYQDAVLDFGKWNKFSYCELIKKYTKIDLLKISENELIKKARELNLEKLKGVNPTKEQIIDALFDEYAQKNLVQPTIVYDYPVELCPLAKKKRGNDKLAERFEIFIYGMEIGNAYSELNNPIEQKDHFLQQVEERKKGNEEAQPMDEDYVKALEYGMPPTAGLGIGVDRLVMLLTNSHSVRDVLLFPFMKPL